MMYSHNTNINTTVDMDGRLIGGGWLVEHAHSIYLGMALLLTWIAITWN